MSSPYSAKASKGKEEPEAYIIGWQPFIGLKIYLDSKPLIPRTETEWWTEQLISNLCDDGMSTRRESHSASAREEAIFQQKNTPLSSRGLPSEQLRFLDLCAGSGAIGCAMLARLPNAKVYFGEIDPAHEVTILKNIRENNLDESRADIRVGDLFEPFSNMKFDVIAINPPYIPAERELPASVADYEPTIALRSGADGLDLIRRIALELPKHLSGDGEMWLECDSPSAETASGLFTAQGFSAEIRTDQYDRPRIIVVSFK